MPSVKPLADDVCVCAFVPPEKLAELAPRFRTIINNRPDAEEPGQPGSAQIEAEARLLGLDYVHLPVVPGKITDEQAAAFGAAIAARKRPILAFCRTGTRSATLWALSQSGKRSPEEIIETAAAAGYDLSALKPKLEEKASVE
jgi:sulfide:quinone oxidoreductase